jgi:stage V sporulation protein G
VEITEVRIKLMDEPGERLKAFCSITFDDSFVVRDLKIIEGASGPFVAMPSRKLTAHCPNCRSKNHLRAAFCNQCGTRMKECVTARDDEGRAKLYADIAHPINSACREMIQERVIRAYDEEKARSKLPGYVPSYDDFEEEAVAEARVDRPSGVEPPHVQPPARVQQPASHVQPSGQAQQSGPQPRGPHRPGGQHPRPAERPKSDFGAGIFD